MTLDSGTYVCVECRGHRFALSSVDVVGLAHDTRDTGIHSLSESLGFTSSSGIQFSDHTRILLIRTPSAVASVRVDRVLLLAVAASEEILAMPTVFARQGRGLVGLLHVATDRFLVVDTSYLGAVLGPRDSDDPSITAPASVAGKEASP